MDAYQTQAQFFKILMHPTRLAILDVLRDGEQCVCHLEAVLALRQAYISQHLMVLRESGLVADRRDGWNIFYRACKPEIYLVIDAMKAFSGEAGQARSRATQATSINQACPCPKCHPDAEVRKSASSDLVLDNEKAAA